MKFATCWKRLAVLWLICMAASGQPAFRDDFTSATLDPAWSVQRGIGDYSLQANPGSLRYIFNGITSNYDGNATWVYRSFSGTQWTLETRVTYSMPFGSGRQHNLRVFLGDLSQRNVNEIRWVRDRDIDRDRVVVDVFEAGIGASLYSQNTGSPDTHFVRIIRQGQTISVETSVDGTSFTRVAERTFTVTLSDMATVLISGAVFSGGGFADYDYIDVTGEFKCSYSLSALEQSFTSAEGLGSFEVTTGPTCGVTPVSNASWIRILPGGFRGTSRVNYAVSANSGPARIGQISVGGQIFTVSQQALGCSYSISPTRAFINKDGIVPGPDGGIRVTVTTAPGCNWTATSHDGWMRVLSGRSGTGNGIVIIGAMTNFGPARNGTATIAGENFLLTQGSAEVCGASDVTSSVRRSVHEQYVYPLGYTYQFIFSVGPSGPPTIPGPIFLVLPGFPNRYSVVDGPRETFLTKCFSTDGDTMIQVTPSALSKGESRLLIFTIRGVGTPFPDRIYNTMVISGFPSR